MLAAVRFNNIVKKLKKKANFKLNLYQNIVHIYNHLHYSSTIPYKEKEESVQ